MIGIPTTRLADRYDTNNPPNHKKTTFKRIPPEDIFPNNLIEREMIFDTKPIISNNPTNREIAISHSLAPIQFHSINHFPVIGTYS